MALIISLVASSRAARRVSRIGKCTLIWQVHIAFRTAR